MDGHRTGNWCFSTDEKWGCELSELKSQGLFVEKILLIYVSYIVGTAPNISKMPFIQCL